MSASVFPARAGMSPREENTKWQCLSVPRASGDEPLKIIIFGRTEKCSPRERG